MAYKITGKITQSGKMKAPSPIPPPVPDWAGSLTTQRLTASNGASGDRFGESVASSGDGNTFIVGSKRRNTDAGAAYVYTLSGETWSEEEILEESSPSNYQEFGRSVALSTDGDIAVVGIPGRTSSSGGAYVFTRSGTTWTEQQLVLPTTVSDGDQYGLSCAISGDGKTMAFGGPNEDSGASQAGGVYIFTESGGTWTEEELLLGDTVNGEFGSSCDLSVDGNTLVVGAKGVDSIRGEAYVFTRSGTTWTEQDRFQPATTSSGDNFGFDCGISQDGDNVIVSSYGEDSPGGDSGAAYVFTRSGVTWTEEERLQPSGVAANDIFGWSCDISGDGNVAVVGTPGQDTGGAGTGSVYTFTRSGTTWTEISELQESTPVSNNEFGQRTAISDDGFRVVSSTIADTSNKGAVTTFKAPAA